MFGAGEIWKRNSLKHSSVSTLSEEFKKFKSIDISSFKTTEHIQVVKDKNSSHVYHIDYPFSDDESDWYIYIYSKYIYIFNII